MKMITCYLIERDILRDGQTIHGYRETRSISSNVVKEGQKITADKRIFIINNVIKLDSGICIVYISEEKQDLFNLLKKEIEYADKWPSYNSCHEGYAVLLEEVDELWQHVKTNESKRDIEAMKKEALQVAACAMRFARDLCNETSGRK